MTMKEGNSSISAIQIAGGNEDIPHTVLNLANYGDSFTFRVYNPAALL